ncbi:MAG: OmpA family protein [Burkholderiaceae bacterium]|nr:OmpA family protein [Burkholderiaceae bacterium]
MKLVVALAAAVALAGCANTQMTERQSTTAKGAGIGAAAGAVLGGVTGGSRGAVRGAVIGAGVGAVGGYVWSGRMEEQKRAMESSSQGSGVQVTKTPDNRLKLEVPSDLSFDVGSADIRPGFKPVLDRFAQDLNSYQATTVSVVGHTDSTGSDAINNPLSVGRASSVRDYLISRGVDSRRIAIEGRGSNQPVADNATDAGRAKNRRVEIFVAENQG